MQQRNGSNGVLRLRSLTAALHGCTGLVAGLWLSMWLLLLWLLLFAGAAVAHARGFTVRNSQILDPHGHPFLIRGVDRPSLEWDPHGNGISQDDFNRMAHDWHANTVRIALNQDFWLKGAARYAAGYPQTVQQTVQMANRAGLVVILDLHWSDKGNLQEPKPGQQRMADANSVVFWKEAATVFRGNSQVMFELYNEPHDVSWTIWQHGGLTPDGWPAVGMQDLVDAVRGQHASNVVIAGGLGWASDLTGVPSHRLTGRNIAYATHQYAGKDDRPNPDWWTRSFGELSRTVPIVVTEFGDYDDSPEWEAAFLDFCQHPAGPDSAPVGWTAWAWFPGGPKFPAIIRDWHGDPTVIGQVVKDRLQASPSPTPAAPG